MTKNDTLKLIKTIRDLINDIPDPDNGWVHEVSEHLDRAADVIEFPMEKSS